MRHSDDHRTEVFTMVERELKRQAFEWGRDRNLHPTLWALVLGEEVGEVSEAILKGERDNYPRELVQVAAVAIAAVEDWLFQAAVCADYELGEGARLPRTRWEPHEWSGADGRTAG